MKIAVTQSVQSHVTASTRCRVEHWLSLLQYWHLADAGSSPSQQSSAIDLSECVENTYMYHVTLPFGHFVCVCVCVCVYIGVNIIKRNLEIKTRSLLAVRCRHIPSLQCTYAAQPTPENLNPPPVALCVEQTMPGKKAAELHISFCYCKGTEMRARHGPRSLETRGA